jgi:hypothetical protein
MSIDQFGEFFREDFAEILQLARRPISSPPTRVEGRDQGSRRAAAQARTRELSEALEQQTAGRHESCPFGLLDCARLRRNAFGD